MNEIIEILENALYNCSNAVPGAIDIAKDQIQTAINKLDKLIEDE